MNNSISRETEINLALEYMDGDVDKLAEPWNIVAAHIGIQKTLDIIAKNTDIDSAITIMHIFKGTHAYFNGVIFSDAYRKLRDQNIRKEFHNKNFAYLSRKYGVSTKWIRVIVANHD